MNYAIIPTAVVLIFLAIFTWRQRPSLITFSYLMANIAIAIWALCFLVLHEFEHDIPVNPISQLQMIAAIVFVNAYYAMSIFYPERGKVLPRWILYINGLLAITFTGLVLFSDFVSVARLENDLVVFDDGPGYTYYSIYLIVLCIAMLSNLLISFWRLPEYRARLAYMLGGIALFIGSAILFDLVLVVLGNYEFIALGHLSTIFPALAFAYAITKLDLMDIKVVIQRNTAKVLVAAMILSSLYLALQVEHGVLYYILISVLVLFWAFSAGPVETFLVTTARRKFVRDWYDAELMLDNLSETIEIEANRKGIFKTLAQEIDSTFELECTHFVCALRDEEEQLIGYELCGTESLAVISVLSLDDPFVSMSSKLRAPRFLQDTVLKENAQLEKLGYARENETLLVPFHSPEMLEGVLILGERSSQVAFSQKDIQFFSRLISYVSAILYKMTPFERLEKIYFENQRRLHEAEIQLVRSEKTRAIAHATRQAHHEIRTPLNIIRLGARRIHDDASAEKYKAIIDAQVERAMEIVDETLAITDGGDLERYAPVSINQLLERCVKLLPDSDNEIELLLEHELPYVEGISSELQVLFSNLLKNATEALAGKDTAEKGKIRVHSFRDYEEIVVDITDNGVGVNPEYREKIWEPYFSGKITAVGNSTAKRGWGLTICNRIITEHKGSIKLISKLGEGSTFTVRLPAVGSAISAVHAPSETLVQ